MLNVFLFSAGIGPGVFLVCASLSGCHRTLAVICFCAALGSMGCYYPGMRVNGLDLTHTYAGIVMALVNGIGTVSGIISPILIGYITRHVSELYNCISLTSPYSVLFVENINRMECTVLDNFCDSRRYRHLLHNFRFWKSPRFQRRKLRFSRLL